MRLRRFWTQRRLGWAWIWAYSGLVGPAFAGVDCSKDVIQSPFIQEQVQLGKVIPAMKSDHLAYAHGNESEVFKTWVEQVIQLRANRICKSLGCGKVIHEETEESFGDGDRGIDAYFPNVNLKWVDARFRTRRPWLPNDGGYQSSLGDCPWVMGHEASVCTPACYLVFTSHFYATLAALSWNLVAQNCTVGSRWGGRVHAAQLSDQELVAYLKAQKEFKKTYSKDERPVPHLIFRSILCSDPPPKNETSPLLE